MDFYNSGRIDYDVNISRWEKEDVYVENKLDNLFTMYEMSICRTNQIYRDLETKIYAEDGTFDDMEYLYSEAEEQMDEQKVGILSKIINFIRNIIKKLKDRIMSLFGKGDDTDIEVPKEQLGMIDKIINHFKNIKAAFTKILSGDILGGCGDLIGAAAFEFTVAAGAVAFITIRKSKLKDKFTFINNINDTIDKAVEKIQGYVKSKVGKGKIFDVVSSALKFIKDKLISPVGRAITAAGKWLTGEKDDNGDDENTNNKKEELKEKYGAELNRKKYADEANNKGDERGRKKGGAIVNAATAFAGVEDQLTDEQKAAYHKLDGDPRAQKRYLNNLRNRNIIECVGFWFDDDSESFFEDVDDDYDTFESETYGFWD